MSKQTKYTILHKGDILYKNLTEEEYFDIMEDLSIEYYQKGFSRPQDLETKITNLRSIMAVRSKSVWSKTVLCPVNRKSLVKETVRIQNIRQRRVTRARKRYRGQGR